MQTYSSHRSFFLGSYHVNLVYLYTFRTLSAQEIKSYNFLSFFYVKKKSL
jgi:hypothetical protein